MFHRRITAVLLSAVVAVGLVLSAQTATAIKAQDATKASAAMPETIRLIDRAAQKGVLKKNTAARYKSRLSLRFNALKAAKPAA